MRSCVEIDPSMDGECVDHVEEDGSERHLCYCTEDGCNATPDTVKVPSKCPVIDCYVHDIQIYLNYINLIMPYSTFSSTIRKTYKML